MQHENYIGSHGQPYAPQGQRFSYTSIEVLPELEGRQWDEVALAYVHGLRPTYIRVSEGELTTDSMPGRVTVITRAGAIVAISMEVEVCLPNGFENAAQLNAAKS